MNRKLGLLAAAVVALHSAAFAEDAPTYDALLKEANAGFEAEDWSKVAKSLDAAQELRPYSQFITRNRVLAYAMLGEFDRAQAIVSQYAEQGLSLRLTGHPGFEALTSRAEFAPIAERMTANVLTKGESTIVLEMPENNLLPETVAAAGETRFIGSIRTGKILRGDGSVLATASGGVYGLEIIGKEVWATVNSASPFEGASAGPVHAGLRAYSLADGSSKMSVDAAEPEALLGDLEKTPRGIVASDSLTPRLYLLGKGGEKLTLLAQDPRFVNLQGIAFDKKRKVVFVADYLAGLFSVELKSGSVTAIKNAADAHLGGIDGLYLYKGDLIGIQNGTTPQRIVKIDLNKKGDAAEALTVLVQNHAQWHEPTNGQIVGDELHYVATSNWPAYGADGTVDEKVERAPVRIMSVSLGTE